MLNNSKHAQSHHLICSRLHLHSNTIPTLTCVQTEHGIHGGAPLRSLHESLTHGPEHSSFQTTERNLFHTVARQEKCPYIVCCIHRLKTVNSTQLGKPAEVLAYTIPTCCVRRVLGPSLFAISLVPTFGLVSDAVPLRGLRRARLRRRRHRHLLGDSLATKPAPAIARRA